jgi:hypothetical protein
VFRTISVRIGHGQEPGGRETNLCRKQMPWVGVATAPGTAATPICLPVGGR